jgi:hypothetical protein
MEVCSGLCDDKGVVVLLVAQTLVPSRCACGVINVPLRWGMMEMSQAAALIIQ